MSQPPQNGWGQPPQQPGDPYGQPPRPGEPYGQPSPNGGYGASGPELTGSYGPPSPNAGYGQDPSFAPSFGGGTVPQSTEPPRNNLKWPLIICGGCAVLVLILVVVGGGIFLLARDGDEEPDPVPISSEPQPTGESPDEPTEEEPTEEETTPAEDTEDAEPTAEETTDGSGGTEDDAAGTRDQPYGIGETFTLEDGSGGTIDVTLGEADWDATDAVMEANQFNTEPAEGEVYVLVPITVTYHGEESVEPMFLLAVDYVADAGNSYTGGAAVTPNSALDVGTLYDGGSAEWDEAMLVPEDQVQDGLFNVSVLFSYDQEDVWVAAE